MCDIIYLYIIYITSVLFWHESGVLWELLRFSCLLGTGFNHFMNAHVTIIIGLHFFRCCGWKLCQLHSLCANTILITNFGIPPCGGGLEYLHHSPARRTWQWKGNPVCRGVTEPPYHWGHKYRALALQVGAWMKSWWPCFVKKILLWNPKKWKPDGPIHDNVVKNAQIWQNLQKKAVAQRRLFCQWWWWLWRFWNWLEYITKEMPK
jgi:hypothetical protein